jgi:hypothetical protein
MALALTQANSILRKLGLAQIRKATRKEQLINEYGDKLRWVIDRDEWQALKAYRTVASAFKAHLSMAECVDATNLTAREQDILRQHEP